MNTLTRSLIAVGTAGAVFVASFAITGALRQDAFPIDDPITVPGSTSALATVLQPVAQGVDLTGADPLDLGVSEAAGSLAVTVPDALPDAPSAPPEIFAAAAALDAAAGDAASLMPATPEGAASPTPSPASPTPDPASPSPDPAETGDPASDPCAPTEGEVDASCPEGVTATLFSLRPGEELEVYATADPVTGPGMGSSIYCDATAVPDDVLRLGGITNDTGTVTIMYWPQDDPSTTTSVTLTQVQTFAEGSARHCGKTEPLAEGSYQATAFAINDDGIIASPWSFTFDSRGRPTAPAMRTVPLGTNWVWVGVYHGALETADLKGFSLVEGGPTTCEEARPLDVAGLRPDVPLRTGVVTAEWLRARNFDTAYTRVTSAVLYVPEGASAGVCGLTFATGEPSWDVDEPERVQFATVEAPDSWEAVVTLRSVTVFRPGTATIQPLTHTGLFCGYPWSRTFEGTASDAPTTHDVGQELCRIAGQNVQLDVQTTHNTESGALVEGDGFARFVLLGESCTGACPAPEPRTYNVLLPGLGQDPCPDTAADTCETARRTLGARATIDVTWEAGGDGARERWGASSAVEVPITSADATAGARFDQAARFTTSLDAAGFDAAATTTVKWDRPVTYSAQLLGTCFERGASSTPPPPITGTARPLTSGVYGAAITVRSLCPGNSYAVTVTYTDEAGTTQVAGPAAWPGLTPDVLWPGGGFVAPQRFLEITAKVEVTRNERVDTSYLIRDSLVYANDTRLSPSFGPFLNDRCFATPRMGSGVDTQRIELARTFDIQPAINVVSDWLYSPNSATCEWRAYNMWVPASNSTVTLAQLLAGVEINGTTVQRDFPDAERPTAPFTYRIILTAEYATEGE